MVKYSRIDCKQMLKYVFSKTCTTLKVKMFVCRNLIDVNSVIDRTFQPLRTILVLDQKM